MGGPERRRLLFPAVLLTLALVWMAAPTYPMVWGVDPSSLGTPNPVTHHSWLDPLVIGYGGFHAPLTFVAAAVAAVLGWVSLVLRQAKRSVAAWSSAAILILVAGSVVLRAFDWPQGIVIALLTLAAVGSLWARRTRVGSPN